MTFNKAYISFRHAVAASIFEKSLWRRYCSLTRVMRSDLIKSDRTFVDVAFVKLQTKTIMQAERMTKLQGEKMNKSELIAAIAAETGGTKSDAASFVDALITTVTNTLTNNDKVLIPGFMTIEVAERKARTGRNPQTGQTINIAAAKVVKFKAGIKLKEAVKGSK